MIIRKLALGLAATALAVSAAAGGAGAAGPLGSMGKPFTAEGVIFNDAPPQRMPVTEQRVYIDGDNFTLKPVTYATPHAAKVIDAIGGLGIYTLPTTSYTLNGNPSDFAGAIVEGCTTVVNGFVFDKPTQVARDELYATTVATTCP